MRYILLTLGLLCTSTHAFVSTLKWVHDVNQSQLVFEQWIASSNKNYGSTLEYLYRLYIFHNNLAKINAHNKSGASFTMGLNDFADLTSEEFLSRYTSSNLRPNPAFAQARADEGAQPVDESYKNIKLDNEVNWVEKGALNPIQNQANCGSCYAFSSIAAIEAADFIFNQPQVLKKFSEQYIVDCGPQEVLLMLHGCNGGLIEDVYKFSERRGVFSDDDVPYTASEGSCPISANPVIKLKDYQMITSNTMNELLTQIMISPVALSIQVTPSYQFYKEGIIDIKAPCGLLMNHGVVAVGYKLDADKPYLLIRNSYGESWGEHGYFRHAIGKLDTSGSCGVANAYGGRPIVA